MMLAACKVIFTSNDVGGLQNVFSTCTPAGLAKCLLHLLVGYLSKFISVTAC